ncbi:MAG: hypothetical protein WA192_02140 [Candidatus Acidiferrales bacterium]
MRAVSSFSVLLAAMMVCAISLPAFASGDDKPAAPSPAVARPDREKKVYTNDDIDQMFPKAQTAPSVSQASETRAIRPTPPGLPAGGSRSARVTIVPTSPEKDPLWYAAQLESLYAELDQLSSREASLREFRSNGTAPGVTIGLQFDAPCEGITTDNAIQQLAIRRQEIKRQIAGLQDTAQQNDMPPAIFQDPSEILQAARKPLSPLQAQAALAQKQSELAAKLNDVHSEVADMSSQAAAQGIVLLPPTPDWGGNLTTNLIQTLDSRAGAIKNAIAENEDAARQAGLPPSALR